MSLWRRWVQLSPSAEGAAALTAALLLLGPAASAQWDSHLFPSPDDEGATAEGAPTSPGQPIPPVEEGSLGRFECFERADALVSLDDEQALRLCDAAESTAPVQCYELAHERGLVDENEALALCQYATSAAPAQCYLDAQERTFLDDAAILQLCRPAFFGPFARPYWPYP
jgi:hypothetical protein